MDAEKLFKATKKGDFEQVHQILETLNDPTKEKATVEDAIRRLKDHLSNHKFKDKDHYCPIKVS